MTDPQPAEDRPIYIPGGTASTRLPLEKAQEQADAGLAYALYYSKWWRGALVGQAGQNGYPADPETSVVNAYQAACDAHGVGRRPQQVRALIGAEVANRWAGRPLTPAERVTATCWASHGGEPQGCCLEAGAAAMGCTCDAPLNAEHTIDCPAYPVGGYPPPHRFES